MLNIGRLWARQCGGVTRRELLQAGALGAAGLTLGDLLRVEARASEGAASARSVILLWLWGGPSHLDTFDMKPQAPIEYRGPYAPVATSVPGFQICELLPQLARRADRYTTIRSLHTGSNDHGIAGTVGLTGTQDGGTSLSGQIMSGQLKPTHGAIAARLMSRHRDVPQFMTLGGFLHQGKRAISGEDGGLLGALYDPFRLDYDPIQGVKIPQLDLIDGQTPDGMSARRSLLTSLDGLRQQVENSTSFGRLDQFYQQAFSLLTSPQARQIFELNDEPDALRLRYGRYRFGQSCLLARRLIEVGARFVQVNWSSHVEPVEDTGDGGWDMHDRNFQQLQDRHAWMLDQAMSTLLDDLEERGLLDETIVVALGEFGRTPRINGKSGRDHWEHVYSGLVAGGGIPGGIVLGASDRLGEHPASRPVTPGDLFTTVLSRLGIGTSDLTGIGLVPTGEVIEELA
ncbi:MAG: DUF1501 domain-containing protein [Planctomycetaceae bacterium]|nr:DUF1501 domain-containing protein [Planctomycetaceae bacterium]